MLILPAIDIRNGQCVRLFQGKEHLETVYSKDPLEMAQHWYSLGARMLHIADLDGAFKGKPVNLDLVKKMKEALPIPIELGGGFRDIESIDQAIKAGVDRVILGTAAVYDPELVKESVQRYGSAMAVSIDVSEDFVAVAGWKELSTVRFDDLAHRMREIGIQHLLFTDTRKDGTLSGPNIPGLKLFLKAAQVPVIASGGISTIDDVKAMLPLANEGLDGIVIGKALYDHKVKLEDALAAVTRASV